jgi:hypothetical protein
MKVKDIEIIGYYSSLDGMTTFLFQREGGSYSKQRYRKPAT